MNLNVFKSNEKLFVTGASVIANYSLALLFAETGHLMVLLCKYKQGVFADCCDVIRADRYKSVHQEVKRRGTL